MDTTPGLTVVITGASYGVGRATARAFGARGARVALLARGRDGLEAAREEIQRSGGEALVLETDVADPEQVEAAAAAAEERLGEIDVWVNSAMATVFAPVSEVSPDEFRRATEATYLGYVWGTMAALRRMRPRDRGTIVQVGSALAYRAIPLQAAYCGAKFAIRGFTDALRSELLHEGSSVRLTMVQLPALNTPQFSLGRTRLPRHPQPVPPIYQPEVAADAIVHAAEHPRRELWVGGSTVLTILGNKLLPGIADRYLARTGYDSQQTAAPVDPARVDNLFAPVRGDHGAHGVFDAEAHDRSLQLELSKRRGALAAAGLGVLAVLAALRR